MRIHSAPTLAFLDERAIAASDATTSLVTPKPLPMVPKPPAAPSTKVAVVVSSKAPLLPAAARSNAICAVVCCRFDSRCSSR